MSNYDFSTLNDKEFEQIAKDLLNAKFKLDLQNFRVGKDKGIDLRFSTARNNNSIVVQVKHYIGSNFNQLKHTLLKKELDKVKDLKPKRYIIVTSLPLSAIQKDKLREILSPFVKTSNDIIGQEDLNGYLDEFKEIEKKYFKLWFSSLNVFNAVINNAIERRSENLLKSIKNNIPFYVVTNKIFEAIKILKEGKLLLITGQPGIGKTTMAEIILFDWAKNGYNIYKIENIREAEDVISPEDKEKQLFYFDDFLGANYSEIVNAHKTETQLTSFVERVKNSPNKYLILTTRTVILNQAIEKYEKISHSKISNQQYEIKLLDYSKYEKALILYNHLYFREIKENLYDVILNDKFYMTIVQHKNYTPRIIEFITDNIRIEKFLPSEYLQFILNNLNNPKEIWRYSYNNQIDYLDKCFLLSLFTFEGGSSESALFASFQNRLEYEKTEHNQIIKTDQFNESVRILLNGFIISYLYDYKSTKRVFQFINPSLVDFLIGHVSDSFAERKSIISSITFIEQLYRFNPEKALIPLEKELQLIIRDKISKSNIKILEVISKNYNINIEKAIFMEVLCKYCFQINFDTQLLNHFKQIDFKKSWFSILQEIEYVLLHLGDSPQTFNFIKGNFIEIIEKMMECITETENALNIPILFEKFEHDYSIYAETTSGYKKLLILIKNVLQSEEEYIKNENEGEIFNLDEVSNLYDDLYSLEYDLKDSLFPNISLDHNFGINIDENYWKNVINDNYEREESNVLEKEDYSNTRFNLIRTENINDENLIHDLFIKVK